MTVPNETHTPDINNTSWILSKRYWYWLSFVFPAAPLVSAYLAIESGNGAWLWLTVALLYIVIPILDPIFGNDNSNPDEPLVKQLMGERYYVYIMMLATPIHWISLIGMAYVVSQYNWTWLDILGGALSVGITNATAIVAAHEMGHKVKDATQITYAKLLLACSGYGHFCIEHNKGHHKDVSTPEDPASAQFGETIYQFVQREIPGAWKRARKLESTRLSRLGKSEWSLSNEIIQADLITIAAYTLMLAFLGPVMIPFLAIAASFAWWQLTCANYVEHYGLLRLKNENDRYERCQPHHSWNSNQKLSNLILLHLQRHSDHHAHPTRPYQALRDYHDVPTLPSGYPTMFIAAMIPKLWFSILDPKVIEWAAADMDKINIKPECRDEAYRHYHNPI